MTTGLTDKVDIVEWLRAEFLKRKEKNQRFSLRAFARQLDIHPGRLSEIFSRKRMVTEKLFNKLTDKLNLPSEETEMLRNNLQFQDYFQTISSSRSEPDKGDNQGQIKDSKNNNVVEGQIVDHSFLDQERIIQGRMPALESIYEDFTRRLKTILRSRGHKEIDAVNMIDNTFIRAGALIDNMTGNNLHAVIESRPLGGYSLVNFSSELLNKLMDIEPVKNQNSDGELELSDQQMEDVEEFTKGVLEQLNLCWEKIFEPDFSFFHFEFKAEDLYVCPSSEVVLITTFQVVLKDCAENLILSIVMPYFLIEPIKNKLCVPYSTHSWPSTRTINLDLIPHHIEAKMVTELKAKELMQLQVGDIINFKHIVEKPFDAYVGDVKVGKVKIDLKHKVNP